MTRLLLTSVLTSALMAAACGGTSGTSEVGTPATSATAVPSASAKPTHAPKVAPSLAPGAASPTPLTIQVSPSAAPSPLPAGVTPQSQWAVSASATSSYSATDWDASHAAGAPDAQCGVDDPNAWASSDSTGIDTLTLVYTTPVTPTLVRFFETLSPGRISKVVLSGGGQSATVYDHTALRATDAPCAIFEVPVSGVSFKVDKVAVTIDQSTLGGWDEIDAVELRGLK